MSALSRARLAGRLYLAAPAWSAVVGILVLLVTALLVAAPRAADSAAAAELRQSISEVRGVDRDLAAQAPGYVMAGSGEAPDLDPEAGAVYGALEQQLATIAREAAPAVRERLGAVDYVLRSGTLTAPLREVRTDVPIGSVRFAFDPRILDRVDVVAGTAPAPATGEYSIDPVTEAGLVKVDIMMSAESARVLGWELGQSRIIRERSVEARLTGTFEARDAEAAVWQHVPSVLAPEQFDDGNAPPRATATVYVAPGTVAALPDLSGGSRLVAWFPFDADGISLAEAQSTLADLRRFTNQRASIPALGDSTLRFSSGILDAIERVLDRSDSTAALLVLVGSGPLGVAGAVLGLAAHGVVTARRPTLELAAARGASPGSLRRALAAEGALVGIPAAALGCALALALTPGPVTVLVIAVAVIVGLAPAVVFAARAAFPLGRAARQDLGARTRGRLRLAFDLVVTGLAVLSTVFLLVGGGVGSNGVDVLAVVAPLLLATAGALLGERLMPAPAGAALRRAARGPRLAGFLGLARAVRDPGGSIAHLALVVAIAIAAASTVLLATLDRGTVEAAEAGLGGDLRIEGAPVLPEQLEELAALPGIAVIGGIEAIGSVTLTEGSERRQVPAYVVDGAALARIQRDFPEGLGEVGDAVPFVASPGLAAELAGQANTIDGVDAHLVGSAGGAAGVGGGPWIMVDRSASDAIGAGAFTPRVVVVGLERDADVAAVDAALADRLPSSRVTVLEDRIAQQRATPIPATLRAGFAIAIVLAVLLATAAVVMTARLAAPGRTALARGLRRLGVSRREIATTLVVEAIPATLGSLVVGAALGAAIPFLVVAAVDLGPLVGGISAPRLVADPLVLGGIVVAALVAGAVSIAPVLLSSRKESA